MDEKTLGLYIRFWRLLVALRLEEWPAEETGLSKKEVIEKLIAPFARDQLDINLSPNHPRFLHEVESVLSKKITAAPKAPPPNIPPNLQELVKNHQEFLVKKAEEQLKTAGVSTIEEQVEKTHQHLWEGVERRIDEKGEIKTSPVRLEDQINPVEPEIPESKVVQEEVYQALKKAGLLDSAGQPDSEIWKNPTPEQKTAIVSAQKKLGPLLHFDELVRNWEPALVEYNPAKYPPRYPTHAYWALEETPALLLYPERLSRLAVTLGREHAQKINNRFYEVYNQTLEETGGDQEFAQKTAQNAAETLTVDLFENPAGVKEAVEKVFTPVNLPKGEQQIIVKQALESLQGYARRYLNPITPIGRENLRKLVPSSPKEVFLDVDPGGYPRIRANPLGEPQNETTFRSIPTQEGSINQAITSLRKGPLGSEAVYLRDQMEYFINNPMGALISWSTVDPAIGLLEALVPGAKQLHLFYIDYQLRRGELMRWIYLTPQLKYLGKEAIKRHLGVRIGLYKEIPVGKKLKPVPTPWTWLGKATSSPFRTGAYYFFRRSRSSVGLFRKNFWFGLGKAFRRREQDWDRSPLVLLIKLGVDLTFGMVGRLVQKAVTGRFARLFAKLTETGFGKRFLGRPTIRAFRTTLGIGKTWARSLFSVNTLSGGFLGYAIGAPLGAPQLGMYLGGLSGWHYEFFLNVGKNERAMLWLQEGGGNLLSRGFRAAVRIPSRWFVAHPYARFPFKGLAFGYVLYLVGFPAWIIPLAGGVHWAWSTKSWWGPKLLAGAEKIPGLGKILGRLLGFLSKFRFLGLLGKFLSWAFPVVTTAPLILDIFSGTPPLIALQKWFSGPLYLGQMTLIDIAFLTKALWWPALKAGLLAVINFIIPDVIALWLYETIPAIIAAITSASVFTLLSIAVLVLLSGFTLYLITSAFFVERAITAYLVSPELPIEKTVTPVLDQNGEIIGLDYTLTYTYNPKDENAGVFDQITVYDRFEEPGFVSLVMLYDPNNSAFSPCEPDLQPSSARISNTFNWTQGKCSQLGPLNPGESRTITMRLALKNPPLSNHLRGDEMLCDNLTVTGQIQGGKGLSSSSPPVCINAEGETWVFGWPTSTKQCSSNYGYRKLGTDCQFHEGIDINIPGGTPVMAASSGTICAQGWSDGYGWYTIIAHDRGLYTLYAHLQGDKLSDPDSVFNYSVGHLVDGGEVIASSGNSGKTYGLNGYHLHFGISSYDKDARCQIADFARADRVVDPCDYLPGCPAACLYQPLSSCGTKR